MMVLSQRIHMLLRVSVIHLGVSFLLVCALSQAEETQVNVVGSVQDKNIYAIQMLCAKEWPVRVTSLQNGSIINDMLSFSDSKVKLNNFYADKKLSLSQVKVMPLGDGSIRWETVQTNDSGNRVNMKGELKEGAMVGMFNWWTNTGVAYGFYFASLKEEKLVTKNGEENTGQVSTLESNKQ